LGFVTALTEGGQYYRELPDGTIKQMNPFSGVQVWTVPGRGARPLGQPFVNPRPISDADRVSACSFCADRVLETPPEKSRLIGDPFGEMRGAFRTLRHLPADELSSTTAEFRRIPNLFEILTWQYWHANHGADLPEEARQWQESYLSDLAGLAHVRRVLDAKFAAQGLSLRASRLDAAGLRRESAPFFGGGHDLIVARRHYTDDATTTAGLAGSGQLSVSEHRAFIAMTVSATADLYASNPKARYVAVFQNWLQAAGASFDHLHKQLVAIDEIGASNEWALEKVVGDPYMFNRWGPDFAIDHHLVLAANDHAVAFVAFGHRYPSVEIWSTSRLDQPWRMDSQEVDSVSDLLHAVHVAIGADVPTNEEWHHRPPEVETPMPWHVVLKLRVSNPAGFEGGTKIYINTVSPASLCARLLPRLFDARQAGRLAEGIRIGEECDLPRGVIRAAH
jgi:galactose-1-phosphate uridylyltransferase